MHLPQVVSRAVDPQAPGISVEHDRDVMATVKDGGLGRAIGVVEVPEVGRLCGIAVGEVDG